MDLTYNSQKAVQSTLSASGKEVRDVQSKIRDLLASLVDEGTLQPTEQGVFSSLLDNLSEAIDDQMCLSIENMDRVRKSEQQAVTYAKNMRRKMQKVVDYCEQQTGAKIDASLYDPEEGYRLPPARRRKQVTMMGMDLDRVEVDDVTEAPIRTHYTTHGKYSSSDEEERNDDDDDSEDSNASAASRSSSRRSARGSSSSPRRAKRSSSSSSRRKAGGKTSKGGSGKSAGMAPTVPIAGLNARLFSTTKAAETTTAGGGPKHGSLNKDSSARTVDGKRAERKTAGDAVLDAVAHKLNTGTANNQASSSPASQRLHYTSKAPEGPDRLTLEGLSCFLYSLLQSTSHLVQAERARLYLPHQESRIMKVVCAVPDASIVCYRGGQYVAAHQGLPGAAAATGVAISVDRVNDDIRRNYLSTTLHGGGSLAADENRSEKNGGGGANRRSGTVESILVFPIRHSSDTSRVVGVFEFINKIHMTPWSVHDEQLCFNAARLASYWLSSYESLLDLHQMPAFQPQESYFMCAPYRPAGYTRALERHKLNAVGNHMLPLFVARVTEMEDIPSKKTGVVVGVVQSGGNESSTAVANDDDGASASPSTLLTVEPNSGPSASSPSSSKPSSILTSQQQSQQPNSHDRIKEVGAIRYVRELTAYLRELERTGRSNVAEIVSTRDAQGRQVDDLIKTKSKVKALEDNNTYLREKLLDTQKKLSVYMNQMGGHSGGAASAQQQQLSVSQMAMMGGRKPSMGNLGGILFGDGGGASDPTGTVSNASFGSTSRMMAMLNTSGKHHNTSSFNMSPSNQRNSSSLFGGSSKGTGSPSSAPASGVVLPALSSPSNVHRGAGPPSQAVAPSLASLKDFLHEAQLSLQSLKTQALMSAPPSNAASTYSALSFGGGPTKKRRAHSSMK